MFCLQQKGLQLLSLDDAVNADREMNSASEMNNCISAGNAFRLNYSIFEMDEPGIVFCCSDGCFDYLPSRYILKGWFFRPYCRAFQM